MIINSTQLEAIQSLIIFFTETDHHREGIYPQVDIWNEYGVSLGWVKYDPEMDTFVFQIGEDE